MQRRDFIKSAAAAGIIGTVGRWAHAGETGWRRFEITYRINMKEHPAGVLHPRTREAGFFDVQDGRASINFRVLYQLIKGMRRHVDTTVEEGPKPALTVRNSISGRFRQRSGTARDVLGTCSEHLKNPDGRSGRARAELGSSLGKLGLPTCCAASPTIRQRGFTNSCVALAIAREGSRCSVSAFADPRCSGMIALDQQAETTMIDLEGSQDARCDRSIDVIP